MTFLGNLLMPRRTTIKSHGWLCAYKQEWFSGSSYTFRLEIGDKDLQETLQAGFDLFAFLCTRITKLLLSQSRLSLDLSRQHFSFSIRKTQPTCRTGSHKNESCSSLIVEKGVIPTLSNLPVELRLCIFDHYTRNSQMTIIGYRGQYNDAFHIKERAAYALLLTCRQFYMEGLRTFLQNLSLTIKAACPSKFSGDMSAFGSHDFRRQIRRVKLGRMDFALQSRIQNAFVSAEFEYSDEFCAGAREGACYFR